MIWKLTLALILVLLAGFALWRFAVVPGLFPPTPPLPELAHDLPKAGASEAFGRRISNAFPPGTPETSIIATLEAQSFDLLTEHRSARFEWKSFPCVNVLLVTWQAENGRVTGTAGSKQRICP